VTERLEIRVRRNLLRWLRQGISPRRLAITLALGFAVGCIPVLGLPTVLCAALAFGLRLNLPAIQAANYAAMPFQLALILPFVRLGERIFRATAQPVLSTRALAHLSASGVALRVGALTGHALVAWLLLAAPAVLLMTASFTAMLRRIPALAATESGD
jgi:uncharacterized protein (DUF2062 family)